MKNFYHKTRKINSGTESQQHKEEYGPLLCNKCHKKAEKVNTEDKYSSQTDERGTLSVNWEVITYKCHFCKISEEYTTHGRESSDGDGIATRHMGYGT